MGSGYTEVKLKHRYYYKVQSLRVTVEYRTQVLKNFTNTYNVVENPRNGRQSKKYSPLTKF